MFGHETPNKRNWNKWADRWVFVILVFFIVAMLTLATWIDNFRTPEEEHQRENRVYLRMECPQLPPDQVEKLVTECKEMKKATP